MYIDKFSTYWNDYKQELKHTCQLGSILGGGSPSGSTTTTSTSAPWSGQQPYLTSQYQAASNLYNNPADYPQLYPGSTSGSQVAPFNSTETSALSGLTQAGMDPTLVNSASNAQNFILNGGMLSQGNPYQQAELNALNAQVTPQLEQQFTQGNSMNNPAAAYAVSQGLGSADANVLGQNYNNAQTQLTQNIGLAPNTYQSQLTGLNTALGAGQATQSQAQNVLNSEVGAYNYNQQLPYNMLSQYAGYIAGNPGSSGSITSPYFNNNAANIGAVGSGLAALATPGASGSSALGSIFNAATTVGK